MRRGTTHWVRTPWPLEDITNAVPCARGFQQPGDWGATDPYQVTCGACLLILWRSRLSEGMDELAKQMERAGRRLREALQGRGGAAGDDEDARPAAPTLEEAQASRDRIAEGRGQ